MRCLKHCSLYDVRELHKEWNESCSLNSSVVKGEQKDITENNIWCRLLKWSHLRINIAVPYLGMHLIDPTNKNNWRKQKEWPDNFCCCRLFQSTKKGFLCATVQLSFLTMPYSRRASMSQAQSLFYLNKLSTSYAKLSWLMLSMDNLKPKKETYSNTPK